jgi:outer membrane protein assembly factor BamB
MQLIAHGRADGKFTAYRATDGKPLWEFDAGIGIVASRVTFLVNGEQYVAVRSG